MGAGEPLYPKTTEDRVSQPSGEAGQLEPTGWEGLSTPSLPSHPLAGAVGGGVGCSVIVR